MSPTMPASSRLLSARRSAEASICSKRHALCNVAARRKPDVLKKRTADEQHEIGITKRLAHLPGVARERLAVARMAGREGRVMPQPFEPHGGTDRFRQCDQRLLAARSRHVVAGDDRRILRLQEQRDQRFDTRWIGTRRSPQIIRRRRIDCGFLFHHIDRQRYEHRALRRVGRDLERAAHDRCDLVGTLDLYAPFRHWRRHRNEVVAEKRIFEPHSSCPAGRPSRPRANLLSVRHRANRCRCQGREQRAGWQR